jgi:hypothetical protein|tara:strand:- start:1087 stop:1722 length:636 start_codon:yes stop_codon:yes gene_type:complete
MVQLITEALTFDQAGIEVLHEGKDGKAKDLFMKGVFIQGGVKNQNQRVYPINEISSAVANIKERLNSGYSVLGEADHPENLTVNLDRVSHMITDMWMDGPNGLGKLKIMPTPMGKIVTTLSESGVKLGVSSRGSGNVNEAGEVQGFEIITVDIVAQPSAPDAYPKAIYEGLWNMRGGQKLYGLGQSAMFDPRAQKHLADSITKLIEELNKK